MTTRIRRATPADLAKLAEIDRHSGPSHRDEAMFGSELEIAWATLEVLEVEPEHDVAGLLLYWQLPGELELHLVAVHPRYRRRGYARALVQHLVEQARAKGAERVTLEVRASNVEARALYAGLGFVEVGRRRKYYRNEDEDAILMDLLVLENR